MKLPVSVPTLCAALSKTTCRQSEVTKTTASSAKTFGISRGTRGKTYRFDALDEIGSAFAFLEMLENEIREILVHFSEQPLHLVPNQWSDLVSDHLLTVSTDFSPKHLHPSTQPTLSAC